MSVQHNLLDQFWVDHCEQLADYRYQVVTTIRLKIMLLSYLLRIPRCLTSSLGVLFLMLKSRWRCSIFQKKEGLIVNGSEIFLQKMGLILRVGG